MVLRSDEIRKRLCGVRRCDRLGPEGYTRDVSDRVYAALADRANLIVRAGQSAIVDAVYARPADRQAIEGVAAATSVPFVGLWLDAPESVLLERVQHRRHDPSDADASVIRMQRSERIGAIEWRRLDASPPPAAVLSSATACLSERSEHDERLPVGERHDGPAVDAD